MKMNIVAIILASALSLWSCKEDSDEPEKEQEQEQEQKIDNTQAYGADISWITAQESKGVKFKDLEGKQTDMFELIKVMNGNAVRLRVWVNPSKDLYSGYCDKEDVLAKAKRAKAAGLRIMIDFHYSDSWADPSKQTKPTAWSNKTVEELTSAVAEHTKEVLTLLKDNQIDVEWVQVGNETTNGMLWPEGKCSDNPKNYAAFTKSGAEAAKAIYPSAKVIVHIDNGWAHWTPEWVVDELKKQGVHDCYDVIGVSYYPSTMLEHKDAGYLNIKSWEDGNKAIAENAKSWVTKYKKKVMVVEFGYTNNKLVEAQKVMSDLISRTKDIDGFEGILMWEPQSYGGWAGYGLGLFTSDGRPGVVFKL